MLDMPLSTPTSIDIVSAYVRLDLNLFLPMETSLNGRALVFGPSGMGSIPVFPKFFL